MQNAGEKTVNRREWKEKTTTTTKQQNLMKSPFKQNKQQACYK